MATTHICPECGAEHAGDLTCHDDFYQLLYWEAEDPPLGVVHHLMVLCYHLQHPSLYAPEGLANAKGLLVDFLDRGLTPEQVRAKNSPLVDSGKRTFKITATADSRGAYSQPIRWTLTAADVVRAGKDRYVEIVNAWAQSVHASLRAGGELPAV